jgi:DNA primase
MNYTVKYNIEKILKDLDIPYKLAGNNARIKCLNPTHNEKDPSMFVHLDTGMYHCFGCGTKGSIFSLVKDKLNLTQEESYQYVVEQNKGGNTEEEVYQYLLDQMSKRTVKESSSLIEVKELNTIPITSNFYLEYQRGFTKEEIHKWNIRQVYSPREPYHNWIYIPIHFKGKLRTWFLRSTFSNRKIYGYHKEENTIIGYPRKDILFGYDSIPLETTEIYGFEGIFDKIWFERTRKQTVAFLGNRISKEQRESLRRFKKLVLGLDNDNASLQLVEDALQLANTMEVYIWCPPVNKKDANECTLEEMIESSFKEVDISEFIQSERYLKWSLNQ